MQWFAIAIGGALGAVSRYGISVHLFPIAGNRFPTGTFVVNVLGCFLVGVCYVLIIEKEFLSPQWRHVMMTGFLGAFTTFSAFSLEAFNLWQNGHAVTALIYIASSIVACLLAIAIAVSVTLKFI